MNRARFFRRIRRRNRNWLNSHNAGLDHVGLGRCRSLAIQPVCSTILDHKCEEAVRSSSLTVGKAATRLVWSKLDIGDDEDCGLGDGSSVFRSLSGRGILGEGGESRCTQIGSVQRVQSSSRSAVECVGGGWRQRKDARESDGNGLGSLVHCDGRK